MSGIEKGVLCTKRGLTVMLMIAAASFIAGMVLRPAVARLRSQFLAPLAPTVEPNDSLHWAQKYAEFKGLKKTRNIVFLGDSRIEFGNWSELFDRCDISNRGIGWDTTTGILRRLPATIPSHVELCVIQAGINDLLQGCSPDFVDSKFSEILHDIITRTKSKVVVTSVILLGRDRAALNVKIGACNQRLATRCTELGAVFVDINSLLCPDGFLSGSYSHDGIHLNWEGYQQIRSVLEKYLPPLVKQ